MHLRTLVLSCIVVLPLVAAGQNDSLYDVRMTEDSARPGLVKRVFNNYFNDSSDPRKPKVLVYPTLAYAPETRLEIGFSSLLLYYAKQDTLNRLSEVSAFTFFTLNKQFGAWFDHYLYTDKDKWFFLGRLRFQRFPLQFYGIGPNALKENEALINADYILIRERVLKKIASNFFIGVEADLQKVSNTSFKDGLNGLPKPLGIDGSTSLGFGAGLVYDTRHNALNVRNGFFAEAAYLSYSPTWGSSYKFNSTSFDSRFYRATNSRQVVAAQLYGQYLQGQVPFNMLALMGGESLMRGYYYGRYRDKALLAGQIEYRFLPFGFSKRLGGAVFVAAGTVAGKPSAFTLRNLQPAGGAGLRFLIFPRKDIYVRFDVAATREGVNFYLYNGEAF